MKLKPCPFCGSEATDWAAIIPWSPVTIRCHKCNIEMQEFYDQSIDREKTRKKLARRWNKRFNECEH